MLKIFKHEFRTILRDEGALLLLIGAAIIYSALYGVIYEPEVVGKIPVAVVDMDNTPQSRDLQRMLSATKAADVKYNAQTLDEAREMFMDRKVEGVFLIPSGFQNALDQGRQAHVSMYADGSYFLIYSSFMSTVADVVMAKGAQVQQYNLTLKGLEAQTIQAISQPVAYKIENLYNPYGGYAAALLPAVFLVLVQQVLLMGIGLILGTWNEFNRWKEFSGNSTLEIIIGKTAALFVIYVPLLIYLFAAVYKFFGYPMHNTFWPLATFMLPYFLSVTFLGLTLGGLFRRRESSILYLAVTSLFFIMISGISWSRQGMPEWLWGLGQILPSSSAVDGYTRMQTTGATLSQVMPQWMTMWLLTVIYFITAMLSLSRARKNSH